MVDKYICQLNYNWYATPENGEEFQCACVGSSDGIRVIEAIHEHSAAGEGDRWFYEICFSDGSSETVFNPNKVFWKVKGGEE